ncbi:beta-N-acetylhexosaminidase [Brevibacterium sanguinis]|uniref:beta-N-acetylhexosaminidase n=2 Tax=Brevibacterium TaxID=1696 RepID=A0A366IPH5_9MICO|nr:MULTISPECIES: glycoside hydrolase family 3 N-terminal domain-containing protein [Brevibacterium]RBP68161.1 beta-N-acetylhexosaminidase [Brevibacterium sanguinis]RBP74422.1 beta-N-acetylhexosaminidase [Brevibacterium celere]
MRFGLTCTALTMALALAGCSSSAPEEAPTGDPSAPTPSPEDLPAPADISPADFADEAEDIVGGLSDEELAGSVIIGTWAGTDTQAGVRLITEHHLGGVIVMKDNLPETPEPAQVAGVTEALAGARTEGRPVSIGVDQEGGPVSRLSTGALPFPPLMALAATGDLGLTAEATAVQARDLTDLGFTIDFAPTADVTTGPDDVTINVRSAGDDHEDVAEVVASVVEGYWAGGMAGAAKHFPGHGRLGVDSHESLPVSTKSIDELEDTDLLPFRSAVEAGVPMVMMGHIALPDATTTPATLNEEAYSALRDTLDHDGVIVTDALNMKAVPQDLGGGETVRALKAGADLALMPPDSAAAQQAVLAALGSGDLKRDDLVEKAERVVAMQLATEEAQRSVEAAGGSGSGGSEAVLTEVAEKSLTVLKGECEFPGTDSIDIVGGSEAETAALTAAAEDEGLRVGSGGTTVSLSPQTSADVAVGTAAPWTMRSTSAPSAVTAYDDNPFALRAVAKWLKGELSAAGRLPVEYPGSDEAPDCA